MAAAKAVGKSVTNALKSSIQEQISQFPTKNALRVAHQDIRWNFAQLDHQTRAVASGLVDLGVQKGDTIGVSVGRSAELVTLSLGGGYAGYQVAASPCGITSEGIKSMLESLKCKILIVDTHAVSAAQKALSESKFPHLEYVIHTGRHKEAGGLLRFSDILLYNAIPDRLEDVNVDDNSGLLVDMTSAGKAGQRLTIGEAMKNAVSRAGSLKISNKSKVLYASEKGTSVDVALASIACISQTAQLLIPSEKFDASVIPELMEQDRCDIKIA